MYSQTYIAVIVNLLSTFLPKIGINLVSEDLTTTIQTVVTLVTGLWILYRRHQAGGVSVVGARKS